MKENSRSTRRFLPLLLTGLVVGCGGDGDGPGAAAVMEMPFDEATAGHVSGMVMFEGTPPPPESIDMASEPECAAHWGAEGATRDVVRVQAGHLQDVFVYVKEGLDGMAFPVPQQEVVIDQVGCRYTPHVSGVMTNQNLTFVNSDPVLHNINATPTVNRGFNISQPVLNMRTSRAFPAAEVMIPIRCDVHGWMISYVGVVAHPYHGVTGTAGTFDLSGLPPGDYVIEAWHPRLGTQEQSVTVATGQTAQVSFTFTEAMLANAHVPMADPIDPHYHSPAERLIALIHGHDHLHGHAPAGSGEDQ